MNTYQAVIWLKRPIAGHLSTPRQSLRQFSIRRQPQTLSRACISKSACNLTLGWDMLSLSNGITAFLLNGILRNASATSEAQNPPISDVIGVAAPFQTRRFAGFPMALPPFLLLGLPRNTIATSVTPPPRISHAEVPKASQPGTSIPLVSV